MESGIILNLYRKWTIIHSWNSPFLTRDHSVPLRHVRLKPLFHNTFWWGPYTLSWAPTQCDGKGAWGTTYRPFKSEAKLKGGILLLLFTVSNMMANGKHIMENLTQQAINQNEEHLDTNFSPSLYIYMYMLGQTDANFKCPSRGRKIWSTRNILIIFIIIITSAI